MTSKPDLKDINGLELDRRVWAYDEDRRIAEIALKGRLEGEWEWCIPKRCFMEWRCELKESAQDLPIIPMVTEVFIGEEVEVIRDLQNTWSMTRTKADSYLGYTIDGRYSYQIEAPSSQVECLRGYTYISSSIKQKGLGLITFGDHLDAYQYAEEWYMCLFGIGTFFIHKSALEPSTLPPLEWVRQFLGTPYLWGGRTAWGIDCSGLAQMYFRYQNIYIPRDADQQEAAFAKVAEPRAGDLAFFDGHVGILLEQNERGNWRMLHANSRHMSVTVDTLGEGEYGEYLSSILHGFGRWEGEIGVYWKPK